MRRSDASNSEAFEAVETDEGGVASGSNPGAVVRASADADADAEGKGEGEEPAGEAAAAEEAAPIATEPPPPPPRSFSLPGAEFWDAGGGRGEVLADAVVHLAFVRRGWKGRGCDPEG